MNWLAYYKDTVIANNSARLNLVFLYNNEHYVRQGG